MKFSSGNGAESKQFPVNEKRPPFRLLCDEIDGCTDLSVLVGDVAIETIRIGKSLRTGALADADHPVLFRMQHSAL